MSEATKREDFINRSMDSLWSYSDDDDFKQSIARLRLGSYSSEVVDLALNPTSYIAVDAENGSLVVFENDDLQHSIPIIALKAGEQIQVASTHHMLQTSGHDHGLRVCKPSKHGAASVFTVHREVMQSNGTVIVHVGRPIVVMTHEDEKTQEFPSVLFHELVHVVQMLAKSVRHYRGAGTPDVQVDKFNDEIEAYDLQNTAFGMGANHYEDDTLSMACVVSGFKRKYLSEPNYQLTEATLPLIQQDEVLRRIA